MNINRFFSTTIGKKFLVALTGLFMIFFLIMHLLGNLEIFSGPDAVNQYANFLRSMPKVLWGFRIALVVSVVLHIWLTISLTNRNRHARMTAYQQRKSRKENVASRTMMWSGITVLMFVLYHLAHYTLGITNPEYMIMKDDEGRHHVYNMMVMGFSHPLVCGFYIFAQILLAFHVSHGVSSAARTLGVSDRRLFYKIRLGSVIFAVIIAVLYISIPFAVVLGIVPLAS